MTKRIHLIVATRPNFMKAAPLYRALDAHNDFTPALVHTGQHYDKNMSDVFLTQLGIPNPDYHLDINQGTHAEQLGRTLMAYEEICLKDRPELTIVFGDVNATAACAISAKKLHIPVAHVEAGLRSNDREMPEEINRLLTDAISDVFLTPSADADENLSNEGHGKHKIIRVGNIMIDSLELQRDAIEAATARTDLGVDGKNYGVITLHRPSNVDQLETLEPLVEELVKAAERMSLVWPIHPRTKARLEQFDLMSKLQSCENLVICEPLGYNEFMNLIFGAACVLTDSGGIQEETTYLGIPCLTLRRNTERPITITQGTNQLIETHELCDKLDAVLASDVDAKRVPDMWDGKTSARIVEFLKAYFEAGKAAVSKAA